MKDYFNDKPWALTEFAIEDAHTNAVLKGQRYADFIHFGKSNPLLPKNVKIATYFHLQTDRKAGLRLFGRTKNPPHLCVGSVNYVIYPSGDDAYQRRISTKK